MRRTGRLLLCLMMCGTVAAHPVFAQKEKPKGEHGGEISQLVGNWSGESVCVNKEKFPACNDEQVIYRVAIASGKSDTLTITADKVVNGKPVTMGTFDFVYNAREQTLVSEIKGNGWHLVVKLSVKGNTLEGTLVALPDKTIVRRIKVTKDK